MHDLPLLGAGSEEVQTPLPERALGAGDGLDDVADGLADRGRIIHLLHEERLALVLEELRDGVEHLLLFRLGRGLLLVQDALRNLGHAVAEAVLGQGGDGEVVEVDLRALCVALLLGPELEALERIEALGEVVGDALHVVGLLAGDGDDAADALCDSRFLEDDEFLDLACLEDVGPAAELDGELAPRLVLGVGDEVLDGAADGDDADGVGVGLAEDGAEAVDLARGGERYVLGVDLGVLLDVVRGDLLDLLELGVGQTSLVREIESELLGGDERALLVDFVAEDLAKRVVEDVGSGVVVADGVPSELVELGNHLATDAQLAFAEIPSVQDVTSVHLDVIYCEVSLAIDDELSEIRLLTTLLSVEVGLVEQDTEALALGNLLCALQELLVVVDSFDGGVDVLAAVLGVVVRLGDLRLVLKGTKVVDVELDDDTSSLLVTLASLTCLLLCLLDLLVVDVQPTLFSHEFCEIDGETVGVVQAPDVVSRQVVGALGLGLLCVLLEDDLTTIQRLGECLLFLVQNLHDVVLLLLDLREHVAHLLDQCGDDLGEEVANLRLEVLAGIAGASSQDSSHDISAANVVRYATVGNGEGHHADVIGDDSVGGIDAIGVLLAKLGVVGAGTRDFLDLLKQRCEDVGVVVGHLLLQQADQALEAHASVDVLVRQRSQRPVGFAVVLHEDVVPDLDDLGVVCVDELGSVPVLAVDGLPQVVVDLRAGAAWALVAHLPEVVLHVSRQDVVLGHANALPELAGLQVRLETAGLVALEVCDVQALGVNAVDRCEQLPGEANGLLLEVIAKGPVAQHLKEGVVVAVLADIVEVVVLAAGADALLRVGGALELCKVGGRVNGALENGLVLVHARIGEEQGGVGERDHRGRGHCRASIAVSVTVWCYAIPKLWPRSLK
jgi:hypothetical protein